MGLGAHYWKPVQAGSDPETDSQFIQRVTQGRVTCHPERHLLREPRSPHAAAAAEGILLQPESWSPPSVDAPLVIEGAGGLMVPLRHDYLFADLLQSWQIPVVLVMHTYLGSINHTLLTAEALDRRGIPVAGMVVNEGGYPESAEVVLALTGLRQLGYVPSLTDLNAATLEQVWQNHFQGPWQPRS